MKTKYTIAFIFTHSLNTVFLVRKLRPPWQYGCLNGIGGHVEPGESFLECCRREVFEESGYKSVRRYVHFATLKYPEATVRAFYNRMVDGARKPQTMTDEAIVEVAVNALREFPHIGNLPWLIHAALEHVIQPFKPTIIATYDKYEKEEQR